MWPLKRREQSDWRAGSALALVLALATACSGSGNTETDGAAGDSSQRDGSLPPNDSAKLEGELVVLTFNTGTSTGLAHDLDTEDGYTSEHAAIADEHYENSLAWNPAEQALTEFLRRVDPDIATFQEMYFDPWCESITVDPTLDFVCRDYSAARPFQIERMLGTEYQVACAKGQPDNCLGVKRSVGRIKGCPEDEVCLGGLDGLSVENCGSGARISSLVIELASGGELTVVVIHATSGFSDEDISCREKQMLQVFVDRGDGQPAASGALNLVMGDLNTDPTLGDLAGGARVWNEHVGENKPFHFISSDSRDGPPTYAGLLRIDHVASDGLVGGCVVPGESEGIAPIWNTVYWDHNPVLCRVRPAD